MAFCSSCGTALREGAKFCSSCGASVYSKFEDSNQSLSANFQTTQNKMGLFSSFQRVVFDNYANFNGRASRAEYWWFALAYILLGITTAIIDIILETNIINLLVTLAMFIPGIAVTARRLHDTNRSGWWQLLPITIIGIVPFFIWLLSSSEQTENRFGSVPSI